METYRLICHSDTPAKTVESIYVEMERKGDRLWLRFHAELDLGSLALPTPSPPGRADDLWKTTCFELFIKEIKSDVYQEYNFSPSGQWAAYQFDGYRTGMAELNLVAVPEIGLDASQGHFALEAEIVFSGELSRFALSAVIEETGGTKSYWAIAHPPKSHNGGKPDFHHPSCFTASLPPPSDA